MQTSTAHPDVPFPEAHHRHTDRLGLALKMWVKFDDHKEFDCLAEEISEDGLLACELHNLDETLLHKRGVCHLHLGNDFFELPVKVVRVASGGLGMQLLQGDHDQFKRAIQKVKMAG